MYVIGVVLLWLNVLGSFFMAIYAYLVLWGPIKMYGVTLLPAIAPAQIAPWMVVYWIALPGVLHALFESAGPMVRSPGNVFLYICAVVTSMASIGVICYALLLWPFGGYAPSLFQKYALTIWGPIEVIEVMVLAVSARLLQRSWFGEGAHQEHGHR